MATRQRVAVLPGNVLLVSECVHLHIGAHVQAVLRLVELVTGPELHPGDGELEPGSTEFVVSGQPVTDPADGDLWRGGRGFGRGWLGGRRDGHLRELAGPDRAGS